MLQFGSILKGGKLGQLGGNFADQLNLAFFRIDNFVIFLKFWSITTESRPVPWVIIQW